MSHISPMSTLSETMNLPLVVAALTSVGLHSLFWFYQPVVPMADKPTAAASDRPSVKVVQLTPEEILRLPQYAQQRTQPTLPVAPGQIPTNLLPSLPEAKSEITLPPPPSFPIYNPNPSTPAPTPESKTPTSRRQTTVPKSPQASASPKPRNNQSSPPQKPETEENLTVDQLNLALQFPNQEATSNQSQPTKKPQPNPQTSSGEFWETYQRYLAQQNLDTTSPNTQTPPAEIEIPPNQNQTRENTAGDVVGRSGLKPGLVGGGTTDNRNQNRTEENQTRTENRNNARNNRNQVVAEARLKAVYGYNPANTRPLEGIDNFERWLDNTKKNQKCAGRLNIEREPIRDSIRSPFEMKLPDVSPAAIAVLVDPEGKIINEPGLILSTGYPGLNKLAIEQVKKRSFNAAGKCEVYQYSINVDQKDLPTAAGAANN